MHPKYVAHTAKSLFKETCAHGSASRFSPETHKTKVTSCLFRGTLSVFSLCTLASWPCWDGYWHTKLPWKFSQYLTFFHLLPWFIHSSEMILFQDTMNVPLVHVSGRVSPTTSTIFYFKPKCYHKTSHLRFSVGSFRSQFQVAPGSKDKNHKVKEKLECHKAVLCQLSPKK